MTLSGIGFCQSLTDNPTFFKLVVKSDGPIVQSQSNGRSRQIVVVCHAHRFQPGGSLISNQTGNPSLKWRKSRVMIIGQCLAPLGQSGPRIAVPREGDK